MAPVNFKLRVLQKKIPGIQLILIPLAVVVSHGSTIICPASTFLQSSEITQNGGMAYTCSPTLTLDENVIPKQKANSNTKSAAPVNDASINNDCTPEKMLPIPSLDSTTFEPASNESMPVRKRAHRNIGSECREILSEIKPMTYLVSNYDDLVALRNELTKLHTKLREGCPSDCDLLF